MRSYTRHIGSCLCCRSSWTTDRNSAKKSTGYFMLVGVPVGLLFFRKRREDLFRDDVFDADQLRFGRVGVVDDALDGRRERKKIS